MNIKTSITISFDKAFRISQIGQSVKGTKNESSNRRVSLRDEFVTLLSDFYQESIDRKTLLSEQWTEKERFYVFSNIETGKPLYPSTPTNWFRKFIERHKLKPLRFHDLRHLHATWLILQGIPLKVVSERLGHSKISTTSDIYGHVLPSADQAAAEALNSMFALQKN